ncbi:U3 small nucleolar RNA-associated protein 18 homolog [Dendronephthya gigantea]|uniref:U3 small nucleolar RNA-associated protein 18 homolog n=1 Tax=Dendronephthya gigantea TaxID=151771 RepID=UPI00106A402D|nr:U3 small nucleolar RNA-associated protein 18 homolog [Dendronephthya gigantea]
MLRRKVKRELGSSDHEEAVEAVAKKHGRLTTERCEDDDDLENLVFGYQHHLDNDIQEKLYNLNQEGHILEEKTPAWVDEDDSNVRVDISSANRLKKFKDGDDDTISGETLKKKLETQFKKIYGAPAWPSQTLTSAKQSGDQEDSQDENEILQHAGYLISKSTEHLPKGIIEIGKVKDANCSKPFDAVVKCVEFHPSSKIILVAGLNNKLNIFQVDGKANANLQTIHLNGFPIHTAHFIESGKQVILASKRKHFYCYDMVNGRVTRIPEIRGKEEKHFSNFIASPDGKYLVFPGKNGYIYLLSSKTKQWIADLKMNGSVTTIAFFADGKQMITAGGDGEVYIWDMKSRRCLHKFKDEGCIISTALAVSPNGQYIACGSDSGVVNIYDKQCFDKEFPKPIKTVMNLTTQISKLKFNSTSEILGMSSRSIKNAFRLLHVPSLSVFSNWPTSNTPLRYVETFDFSPRSGYIAIGNDRGRALLFRLNHYMDA